MEPVEINMSDSMVTRIKRTNTKCRTLCRTVRQSLCTAPVVAGVLTGALTMAPDPASAQLGKLLDGLLQGDPGEVATGRGFDAFDDEFTRISGLVKCRKTGSGRVDEYSDFRRVCYVGKHGSARITAFEPIGNKGFTKKVVLIWDENLRRNGRGFNVPKTADQGAARGAVRALGVTYLPKEAKRLQNWFRQSRDGELTDGKFTALLRHDIHPGHIRHVLVIRDQNWQALQHSETANAQPEFKRCLYIVQNMKTFRHLKVKGNPVPERDKTHVTYFLNADRGDRFLCELYRTGYYRVQVSRKNGRPFKTIAHGKLQ